MRRSLPFLHERPILRLSLMILALGSLLLWLSCLPSLGHAQAPPITPSGLNTQVSGPLAVGGTTQYNITGGTRPGGGTNLFHSFGEFGVPTNNIANFLNETALPTSNILARVTGGNVSNIFGAIQTEGFGNANLFLMNPAGLLFGPNATLNVGGMVTFTSADYLRLADHARFSAIPNAAADALLSASPVAAFGFLGPNPGAITVQGSQLTVSEGTGLSLVGGNITIQSGTLEDTTVQPAQLSAPGGQLNLASAASPGEILYSNLLTAANVNGQSFTTMGTISLSQNSILNVSSNAAGAVRIRGGQLIADSATISANTTGAGNAGEIVIQAGNVSLSGFSLIRSDTTGAGQAGTVRVSAEESISLTESAIFSGTTSDSPTASGGQIILTAPVIDMSLAQLNTLTTGPAPAGDITLATNTLNLMQESEINASTSGLGRSGNITIRGLETGSTAQDVTISGSSFVVIETLGEFGPAGDGGTILVETARLTMQEGGSLRTSSRLSSPGNAGTVTINASESIRIMSGSSIESTSIEGSTGNAGGIHITAPVVTVEGTSFLSTSTELSGNAGGITVNAGSVAVQGGGQLSSSSTGTATGAAGTITVQGLGGAGTLAQSVTLTNGKLLTSAAGAGAGGNIVVNANQSVTLTDSARISASSTGPGNAGNINLNAGQRLDMQNSSITTQASQASGGNIDIQAIDRIRLVNSTISTSVLGGAGGGGNITIDPNSVILQNSQILAQAVQGTGGNITIVTPVFLADQTSLVDASSQFGLNGTVNIQSPTSNLSGTVSSLPSSMRQSQALQTGRCAALANSQSSSLIVAGRETMPTEPGGWLPSPLTSLSTDADTGLEARGEGQDETGEGRGARGKGEAIQIVSLRRLTPAGFLTQSFAESGSTGCRS